MAQRNGSTATCIFSQSADKKNFTDKCVTRTNDGKQYNQTMVYDRVNLNVYSSACHKTGP